MTEHLLRLLLPKPLFGGTTLFLDFRDCLRQSLIWELCECDSSGPKITGSVDCSTRKMSLPRHKSPLQPHSPPYPAYFFLGQHRICFFLWRHVRFTLLPAVAIFTYTKDNNVAISAGGCFNIFNLGSQGWYIWSSHGTSDPGMTACNSSRKDSLEDLHSCASRFQSFMQQASNASILPHDLLCQTLVLP